MRPLDRILWDLFLFALLVYNSLSIPYRMGFSAEPAQYSTASDTRAVFTCPPNEVWGGSVTSEHMPRRPPRHALM